MRPIRALAGVLLLAILALLAAGDTHSQDKDKAEGPGKPAGQGALPRHFDQLGLTDAQRVEIQKLGREYQDRREKLLDELRKLDEDVRRKRAAVLTDDQRKKLIDLLAGPPSKDKADGRAKDKDK